MRAQYTLGAGRSASDPPLMQAIALAIPAFFVAIAVEALVARARGAVAYRFGDAVTNLGIGVSNQVLSSIFTGALRTAAYVWVYLEARVVDFDALGLPTWLQWVGGLLAFDLLYYAWHRANHGVAVLWAAHVVHHHGEDFNLALALRQPWIIRTTALPLFLLLAVLGVPPHIYLAAIAISSLYQFGLHTAQVGRLGPLEWVFNTPSAHRVHHAINPKYIDRNLGGILIVWDRIFGTFAAESETPVYGTVAPVKSANPLWLNVYYFVELARRSRQHVRWQDKCGVWLGPPGWSPKRRSASLDDRQLRARAQTKYDPQGAKGWLRPYIAINLVACSGIVALLLLWADTLDATTIALAGTSVVLATVVWGALLEGRRWAWPLEAFRIVLLASAVLGAA